MMSCDELVVCVLNIIHSFDGVSKRREEKRAKRQRQREREREREREGEREGESVYC